MSSTRPYSVNFRLFIEEVSNAAQKLSCMKVQTAADKIQRAGVPHFFARLLICIFFLDNCLAAYHNWQFYQTEHMQNRIARYPQKYLDPGKLFDQCCHGA